MSEENGGIPRFLTDLGVVLRNEQGQLIDERAQASDISPSGFRVQSKSTLVEGSRLTFTMDLGGGDLVRGVIEIVWAQVDEWGGQVAGAKIVKISRKDGRKLRSQSHTAGFDFSALAKKALIACYWLVIVAGAHNILFSQPHVRYALIKSLPALGVAIIMGFALMLLFS